MARGKFWTAAMVLGLAASLTIGALYCQQLRAADEPADKKSSGTKPQMTTFDYDAFKELLAVVPDSAGERMYGMNENLMMLWKKSRLEVAKEGHLLSGDFNLDGKPDDAVVLEKTSKDNPGEREYYIVITTMENGQRKLLLHQKLPDARAVIDTFWDPSKGALVIDTGKRVIKTSRIGSSGGGSTGDSGYQYESGETFKSVIVVVWNPKSQKFDIFTPMVANETKHRGRSKKGK